MNRSSKHVALIQSRIKDWLEKNMDELSDQERRDIAFHMTDWYDDYEKLKALFEAPEDATDETIEEALDLLYHAPHHLVAAAKLYTGSPVDDVFGIGATSVEYTGKP